MPLEISIRSVSPGAEHTCHLTVVDGARLATRISLDLDALVVELHIVQPLYIVHSIAADNLVVAGDGHGQSPTVGLKSAIQHPV